MTFNRIQMLRNMPMKVARENKDEYLYVQGPSIGDLYEDDKLFLVSQILLMKENELKDFLKIEDKSTKLELITTLLTKFEEKDVLMEKIKKIILDINIKNDKIYIGAKILKKVELERITQILEIIMGQKTNLEPEEKELSPDEKRLKQLEEKVQAKKQKQKSEVQSAENDENAIENIMIAVIYEFGFDFEKIMNMNYFTLIWYYSFTGKLHVYRINQQAIASGMVKKINTDYFTGLK
jgi:hypothetical protein